MVSRESQEAMEPSQISCENTALGYSWLRASKSKDVSAKNKGKSQLCDRTINETAGSSVSLVT